MLAELPELKPTFVIFYDLSRVARDEFDAFWLLREITASGAKLESTMERIDDGDDGCCSTRSWPGSTPIGRAAMARR
jgi:DNA invertase Pin-like site-specific DNA recombinase